MRDPLLLAILTAALAAGCTGDMRRDSGGGQSDGGSPGREVDDGGLDGRTPTDADAAIDADPGDGAVDADAGDAGDGGDGGDGGPDAGDAD